MIEGGTTMEEATWINGEGNAAFVKHVPEFDVSRKIFQAEKRFEIEDVIASLTQSTYNHPKYIELELVDIDVIFRIVITTLKSVFLNHDEDEAKPFGCWEYPEWYAEGWILKSGFDPYGKAVRVRMYIEQPGGGSIDCIWVQRINQKPTHDIAIPMA
jgi:hypothetical protein